MAGYIIYSIDGEAFLQMLATPTAEQLQRFAEGIDDAYELAYDDLAPDDIAHRWQMEADGFEEEIRKHLRRPDWYSDLSDAARTIWHSAIYDVCCEEPALKFRVDSDGVYWDVIEIAVKALSETGDRSSALNAFGAIPYRYHAAGPASADDWYPNHSLHEPQQVVLMRGELNSVQAAIEASGNEAALRDYEDELMPAIDRIVRDRRMLFVSVDT